MTARISRIVSLAAPAAAFACTFVSVVHAAGGAPELDPGNAASGVALLIGGAMLIIERHRKH
jgi:glycerol-3-phosphate acyltransferase PlsY